METQGSWGRAFTRVRGLFLIAACLVVSSCSTGGSRATRSLPDQLTQAEIDAASAITAFELINRLRPGWLRPPNTGSLSGIRSQLILVYLDGQRLGDVHSLRTLSKTGIRSMRWLDAARAAAVLPAIGSDPVAGAIVISTH